MAKADPQKRSDALPNRGRASYSKSVTDDEAVAVFNIWRSSEGKIVEHWSNVETIAPRSEWANSGKS